MTGAEMNPRLVRVEYEITVLDCPPYTCASRCPWYNRAPCETCFAQRAVLSTERFTEDITA